MGYLGDDDKCSGCGCDPCIGKACPHNTNGFKFTRLAGVMVAAGLGGVVLMGCSTPDPCSKLPAPTAVQIQAAQSGVEVEQEINNGKIDCELQGNRWVRER